MDLYDRLQAALASTYRLERELGGGGMSRVFVGTEGALGRRVVIKVLPPDLAAGLSVERFRREIQLAASLQHPHIVPLLAAGSADGLLYYTMPLIEGESLRTKIAREGELPIGEAIRILRDVVDALACAHEHGIVHRDIKPDNVLVSRHHGLVADFGVAKALSEATGTSSITSTGLALGTPAYMAPEQATADPHLDHRVDLYAVGALAYEMLTGRPPFTGSSPQAVLAAQVTQAAEPVTRHRASIPAPFSALVMRCLEKHPADRWQSAEELLHQLEAMATPSGGTAPTEATPAHAPSKRLPSGSRTSRPQRAAYLALGALMVLGLGWGIARYRSDHQAQASLALGKTVAVLPFENLGRPEDEYFADGVTEEITNRLTGIGGLRVISRNSAKQYKGTQKSLKQIGDELGATYALVGTVRWEKAGDRESRLRVSPELIRVSDGTNVWAHGYDAMMSGVFQVQSDIAAQVASALDVALAAPERAALATRPTENAEAYEYYLRGSDFHNRGFLREDLTKAVQMYEEATRLDPRFATAFARLGVAHEDLYWFGHDRTRERLAKSKAAVDEALRLAPDLPAAHVALGWYLYHGKLDYAGALKQFDVALKGSPNDSDLLQGIGAVQRRQGRWAEALANFARSAELEPRLMPVQMETGITHLLMHQYKNAEKYFDRSILLAPDHQSPYGLKAWALVSQGETAQARRVLNDGVARAGLSKMLATVTPSPSYLVMTDEALRPELERLSLRDFPGDSVGFFFLKAQLHEKGRQPLGARAYYDSARVIVEERVKRAPDDYVPHSTLGLIYARMGRNAEAVREAKRAAELLPMTRDAFFGTEVLTDLAKVYTIVGQPDSAIDRLAFVLSVPSWLSPGHLQSDPVWAPLRGNPRFEKLVAGS